MNEMDVITAQIEQELIERDELLNSVDSNTRAYLLSCEQRDPRYITRIIKMIFCLSNSSEEIIKGLFDFISNSKR